jgi:DNA-binding SARP family transcriptional activator
LEFLVLGPLEVRSAREGLSLGGPRRRAVLADLVLHAGSVVAMDTLMDDLWGGAAPPAAEAVVQNAVSRLRKTLGRDVIETRPPGYVLAVDPGAIDAHRFERLVRDARPLPSGERLAALRDALALWRGPAFADLAYESFLQDEITRLDELRLTALEERLEAEIELGRHDAVVAEASALVARHPARERLCRLLMLALHRAGRQQEALDAYEVLRRALDELFGLEPSPETRALQLMILNQDPAIAVGREPPRSIGAVRRPVALLLAEVLVDEELELEAARSTFEDARRAMAEVVARHGGALSPESGVELIAAFGADAAHEDDVLRAARSAVELHEILAGREVDARLAVGTGQLLVEDGRPVLVGAVVGQTRHALHAADAGDLVVTPVAAQIGGDALEFDGEGRLRGVRPGRPRATISSAPLVGRADELASLRSAFDRVVETGRPQHAVVGGDAGIGKSRLVAAFLEDVPAVVLEAACIPYGEGISFLPLRDLHERAAALDDDAPALGELTSADAALAATRTLFEHFTASGPLVVALDDMHWAVPTFLDVVEYVVRAVDGPLLVISATRPELIERRPAWGKDATVLEPLADDEASSLVDALPERELLDKKLATSILQAAEGVPLFLEQLAAHAAEADLTGGRIPPTLDALLASRIDALEPGERDVLSRAAVVGRAFLRESISALTPEGELRELDGRLAALGRRRFVGPHAGHHEFVHPLVHEAVYGAIGRAERARMHERIARWLDQHGEGDELVGVHFERAALDSGSGGERDGRSREASIRLGRAGEQALLTVDYSAAANLLERATVLLQREDVTRLELECHLGHALKGLGELERASDLFETVVARAAAAGIRRLELRARVELTWPLLAGGSITADRAVEVLDEAVGALRDSGDMHGVARAEDAYAIVLGWQKRADSAGEHVARAEEAYRRLGLVGHRDSWAALNALEGSTSVADAIRLCEDSLRRNPDHLRTRAYVRAYLAFLRALSGDLASAREDAATSRAELGELGEELGLHTTATMCFGSIEALAGDWGRAQAAFGLGLEYVRDRPSQRTWHAYFLARLGEVSLGRGDPETALELAEESRAVSVSGDAETDIWWRRVAARALSATGHPRKAARLGREAVTTADPTDNLLLRGEARLDLAEVLVGARFATRAIAVAREGLALLDRKGAVLPAANGRSRFLEILTEDDGEGAAEAAPSERVS